MHRGEIMIEGQAGKTTWITNLRNRYSFWQHSLRLKVLDYTSSSQFRRSWVNRHEPSKLLCTWRFLCSHFSILNILWFLANSILHYISVYLWVVAVSGCCLLFFVTGTFTRRLAHEFPNWQVCRCYMFVLNFHGVFCFASYTNWHAKSEHRWNQKCHCMLR